MFKFLRNWLCKSTSILRNHYYYTIGIKLQKVRNSTCQVAIHYNIQDSNLDTTMHADNLVFNGARQSVDTIPSTKLYINVWPDAQFKPNEDICLYFGEGYHRDGTQWPPPSTLNQARCLGKIQLYAIEYDIYLKWSTEVVKCLPNEKYDSM